jgi:hypothetical protein
MSYSPAPACVPILNSNKKLKNPKRAKIQMYSRTHRNTGELKIKAVGTNYYKGIQPEM